MKKLLLAAMSILLTAGALSAQDSKKWYVSGSVMADYTSLKIDVDDCCSQTADQWSVGAGVAINRMLGDRFSVGLGVSYVGGQTFEGWGTSHNIGVELGFANFTKIVDRLYYVPEVGIGMLFDVSEYADGESAFMAGISPFGLEFRPSGKIGLRVNIVSLAYTKYDNYNTFRISAAPTFSVNFRF